MLEKQFVSIKNLGPITEANIEVNKINLLIGEQAVGKSTISKCIYFFRSIKGLVVEYLFSVAINTSKMVSEERDILKALNTPLKDMFVQLFGYSWDLNENLSLKYTFTQSIFVSITLSAKNDKSRRKYISPFFSPALLKAIVNLTNEWTNYNSSREIVETNFSFENMERIRVHKEIANSVNSIFMDDLETYYIPAGRGLLTLMANQKTKLDYNTIDLVNRRFMQFIESIQPRFDLGISNVHRYYPVEMRGFDVSKISGEIKASLKGDYLFSGAQEYFLINDDQNRISINFASSGQQEVLWLLNQLYILLLRGEKSFVIIEEPEAHLYPKLQKEVLEYIVQFANLNQSSVMITTHSPYMLMALNVLYSAGVKYQQNPKKVEEIIGKHKVIKPEQLYAAKIVTRYGKTDVESLKDDVTNELCTELIDDVSEQINMKYTELVYVEAHK